MAPPLVERSTGDLIPASDQNDIIAYIEDGTYRVNTLSLNIGGTEVLTDARALTNITGNITMFNAGTLSVERGGTGLATVTANSLLKGDGTNAFVPRTYAEIKADLDLEVGTDVQAYSARLGEIAALAVTDSNIIVGNGTSWVAESDSTARTSLGLGTGDDVTFTNVTASTNVTVGGSVIHSGDIDTYIAFDTDKITMRAGGVDAITITEAASNTISFGNYTTNFTNTTVTIDSVDVPTISSTNTLTNKRITPRVTTEASSATPTINTDNSDAHSITALAADITSMSTNLSGTPTDFQKLIIRIKDDGTAREIDWGNSFEANGVALPTTTTISKLLTVGFIYNGSKWGCVAVSNEV